MLDLNEVRAEWECHHHKRKINLLQEEIDASIKRSQFLKQKKESLKQENEDLEFRLSELEMELDSMNYDQTDNEESTIPVESFFSILSFYESQQTELKGKIEASKELYRDLSHRHNLLKQKKAKIDKENEQQHELLIAEIQNTDDLQNQHEDFQTKLLEKQNELELLNQTSERVKNECSDLSTFIDTNYSQDMKTLPTELSNNKKELRSLMDKSAKMEQTINGIKRQIDAEILNQKENNKALNVKNFIQDRSLLISKLKKLKSRLSEEEGRHEALAKKERDIKSKFSDILQGNEDGDCPLALAYARADIFGDININQSLYEEFESEDSYNNILLEEIHNHEVSIEKAKDFVNKNFQDIDGEFNECSHDGYLNLLKQELSEIQIEYNQLLNSKL